MSVKVESGYTIGDFLIFTSLLWPWIFGFAVAKDFWRSLFAAIPPYAWVEFAKFVVEIVRQV
jgi:hypothetical protein